MSLIPDDDPQRPGRDPDSGLEPRAFRFEDVLAEARRSLGETGRVALCQIVRAEGSTPGKVGWKMLVRPDGSTFGNLGGGASEALAIHDARQRLRSMPGAGGEVKRYYLTERAEASRGEATGMVCGGFLDIFLEVLVAAPLAVVCGAGPVGQAVGHACRLAGFDVLVADDREEFLRPGMHAAGALLVRVSRDWREPFLEPFRERPLFAAVVTRCWETDTAALAAILRQAPARLDYLGLLGSRRKIARVRAELAARGLDPDAPGRPLRAPIGLAVGGDSPGEIAVAISAEMLAVRHGRAATVDLGATARAARDER